MLKGRRHPLTPERFLVQMLAVRDSRLTELATVENVSADGTRLATERSWKPGSHVILKSSSTGDASVRARVVYCRAKRSKEFAVGLNFLTQTSNYNA